jgi:hypothetical protein
MDLDAPILYRQLEDEKEDEIQDEQLMAGTAMAILVLGAIESHRLRTERRKPSRLYLCRPQLARNPRGPTAWQILYNSRNDRAYITTMGFDVFHSMATLRVDLVSAGKSGHSGWIEGVSSASGKQHTAT